MARSIKEIQNIIFNTIENEPALAKLNSTSKVSIWRLWVYVISYVIYTLELLFDIHSSEVAHRISELKPHTCRWYRNMALAFQYGFDLLPDSDKFDNTNRTDEEIEKSKLVKYSAVTESEDERRLIVKIIGEKDGKLTPLDSNIKSAFKTYMKEIRDAGVPITVISYLPDLLKLNITIVRDKLVMSANGMNLEDAHYYVNEAIEAFMKELPFNGELSLQALTDKIQKAPGVLDLVIKDAKTSWIDGALDTYGPFESIYISKIPNSGYFAVELDKSKSNYSTINYV